MQHVLLAALDAGFYFPREKSQVTRFESISGTMFMLQCPLQIA